MKSGRERRAEIQTRRSGKRAAVLAEQERTHAKLKAKALAERLRGQVLVNAENLGPNKSYGTPSYVQRGFYVDMPFNCKTCGKAQVWSATQQKWWYEVAKGDLWAIAALCKPCRLAERHRKTVAREVHLAGLARKAARET
jgi:Probable zinc-ribbon domain